MCSLFFIQALRAFRPTLLLNMYMGLLIRDISYASLVFVVKVIGLHSYSVLKLFRRLCCSGVLGPLGTSLQPLPARWLQAQNLALSDSGRQGQLEPTRVRVLPSTL